MTSFGGATCAHLSITVQMLIIRDGHMSMLPHPQSVWLSIHLMISYHDHGGHIIPFDSSMLPFFN